MLALLQTPYLYNIHSMGEWMDYSPDIKTHYFQPRIDICPTCRVPFDGQPYRLYFAERLLEERVPIACRFADDGCKVGFQISIFS